MSEWTRIQKTTVEEHIRETTVNTIKQQIVLAMLEDKGKITFNNSGKKFDWRVKKSRNTLSQLGDSTTISFPRLNRHEVAELPYRGYVLSESISAKEKGLNKGEEAIIKIKSDLVDSMLEDFRYDFPRQLWVDGNATGNEEAIHGFLSCLGLTSNAKYTAPSDTYAGLVTTLGNYGGSAISGTWPDGIFSPQYYFWSPLIVNYTHADWAATTDTWANTCLEATRAGIIRQAALKGAQGKITQVLMTPVMHEAMLNKLDDRERIIVQQNGSGSRAVKLGFTAINRDGVDYVYDSDTPADTAIGLNYDEVELKVVGADLVEMNETFEAETLGDLYSLHSFMNMKLNPRSIIYWKNVT